MKTYLWMSSAGIVIGALRVKNSRYKLQLVNGKSPFIRRGKIGSLKGYCTVFSLFTEIFLINRSSWEKQIAENLIKNFSSKL